MNVRIDQSGKFSALTLLRAMDPALSTNADIIKAFYPTEEVKVNKTHLDKLKEPLSARMSSIG